MKQEKSRRTAGPTTQLVIRPAGGSPRVQGSTGARVYSSGNHVLQKTGLEVLGETNGCQMNQKTTKGKLRGLDKISNRSICMYQTQ